MECKMNLKKAIRNDYGLTLSGLFPVIGAGFLAFYSLIKKNIDFQKMLSLINRPMELVSTSDFILFAVFSLFIIVGLAFFAKRVSYINSFEKGCTVVDGKVVDIHYTKDRCGVDVEFLLFGNVCRKHFALMNNSQTKYVHMDSDVKLIVKDENPKKVLIMELYFD